MTRDNAEPLHDPDFLEELAGIISVTLSGHVANVRLIESEDMLILHGTCRSFHAKQMAMELIRNLVGPRIVINELFVEYPQPAADMEDS